MRDLSEIRQNINEVDTEIRELFLRRMALALEVAQTKIKTDDKILKPEREQEIIETRSSGIDDALRSKYISLIKGIMRTSREYQYREILRTRPDKFPFHPETSRFEPKSVLYQGAAGAYQELAARALFPNCEPQNVPSWEEVFRSVRERKVDAGVVPCENTTAGTVSEVYDLLLQYDLSINRSYVKKIHHCLAAVPGTVMADVKRVCSHPHALPQCHDFIVAHGMEAVEVANTAIAARQVARHGDRSMAAICSAEAAAHYGLTVLASHINDQQHNETRFIAVSRVLTSCPEDDRIEIAFHIPNRAGALSNVLNIFADYDIDMTEIHSRPIKDSPWCYVFYVDFTGNMDDPNVQSLLYQLHEELPFIRVLGSYQSSEQTKEN